MKRIVLLFFLCLSVSVSFAQKVQKTQKPVTWKTVSDDEIVTISYDKNIITDSKGRHIVWVKAVYHTSDWQNYFASQIGSRIPVAVTRTKAMFDEDYNYVMVRQVRCYNKAGKLLYDSGDDASAGWGVVNASDPVGIVGEYLTPHRY